MRTNALKSRLDRSERGATLVLFVMLLLAMLGVVALVLDLAALRQDRRADRNATDSAVAAGASAMGTSLNLLAGCEAAWDSAVRSLDEPVTPSPCVPEFDGVTCDSTTAARTATGTAGDYTISIVAPVPAGHALLDAETPGANTAQVFDTAHDGSDQCERIAVRIQLERSPYFAQALGIGSRTTDVHSVARAKQVIIPGSDVPALVVLEPTGCDTIDAGTGEIRVQGAEPGKSGILRSDTAATASGTCFAMRVSGGSASGSSGALWTCGFSLDAEACDGTGGLIRHFSTDAKKIDPGQISQTRGTFQQVLEPFTRAPIDRVYHCSNAPDPNPCEQSDGSMLDDHIDDLTTRLQSTDLLAQGYGHITDCAPNGNLTLTGLKYFVDCDTYVVKNTNVTFSNGAEIVFKGGISLESNGNLNINTTGSSLDDDALVYLRNGGIAKQSNTSNMTALRTFFYSTGGVDFASGGLVTWTAPEDSVFTDLLYWTEGTTLHAFSGGPDLDMEGIFFMGNARLEIQGSGTLDARRVQFWVDTVFTQGAAEFVLRADPERSIPEPAVVAILIR